MSDVDAVKAWDLKLGDVVRHSSGEFCVAGKLVPMGSEQMEIMWHPLQTDPANPLAGHWSGHYGLDEFLKRVRPS